MSVQIIKATKDDLFSSDSSAKDALKVAAYCRVSTGMEEQESSYEAQCLHYTSLIKENPSWEFAGIYADEGISGTQAKKRPQFLEMISACTEGKIDLILTKSISRFSRNTLDCLQYIRFLKDRNIAVFFEKENINTLDAKGEVLITIMASIAQQESASISQNVTMGIRYKMQRGIGRVNYTRFLGYTKKTRDGPLLIVPEQAEIVRRIFREYLDGFSPAMIASHLQEEGLRSPSGGDRWHASTISSMLENEKYCGDFLMQKTFTEDFLTKKNRKNTGQLPQYYVENHHEPIIPKDIFLMVQGERLRRSVLKNDPTKIRCGSRIALCGRLICGRCGKTLKRYSRPERNQTDWRCHNRAYKKKTNHQDHKSACGCRFVPEEEAQKAVVIAFNALPSYRDNLLQIHEEICHSHLDRIDAILQKLSPADSSLQAERDKLLLDRAEYADKELKIRLLLELTDIMKEYGLNLHTSVDSSFSLVADDFNSSCSSTYTEKSSLPCACYNPDDFFLRTRYTLPEKILDENGTIAKFDNSMVIRYLDFITVMDEGLDIRFKAGISFYIPKNNQGCGISSACKIYFSSGVG